MKQPHGIVLVAGIVLFFVGAGARDFWAPDEPRFAQISQEMLQSGNWIVPTMNGEKVALLPPLTYWSSAAFSLPIGNVTETTARIPIGLAALLCVMATFFLARKLFDPTVGLMAALILATMGKFMYQAEWLQSDMLLVAFMTLSLASFYFSYLSVRHARPALMLFYLSCAMGTLTKGPMAVALPGLVILVFLVWDRNLKYLLQMGFLWGIPLYLALVIPWYYLACQQGGQEFTHELLLKQNFGMFYDTWSHRQPFYYYLGILPLAILPWFLFLPGAIAHLRPAYSQHTRAYRFLLSWAVALFLFYSISSAKQMKYILPLVPALAIWIAHAIPALAAKRSLWLALPFALLAIIGFLSLAGVLVFPAFFPKYNNPELISAALPTVVILAVGFVTAWIFHLKKKNGTAVAAVMATMILCILATRFMLFPVVNHYKSARAICQKAMTEAGDKTPLGIYGVHFRQTGAFIFYTGRKLQTFEDIPTGRYQTEAFIDFMKSPHRVVCFIEDKEYLELSRSRPELPMKKLDAAKIGGDEIFLISNR